LWNEVVGGDRTRRLNPGEDLSDADLRNGDGNLHCHVRGYAEAAVLVGDLSLRVGVRGGDNAANHDEGNTQHTEEKPPRRSRARCCDSAQHLMNIAQVRENWEMTPVELPDS
jgi:hypothetical protein